MQRRDARTATIVGRDVELAALSAAEQAGGGLLLMAEAGAGKSRLLEEAQTRSSRTWLGGGCAPHDTSRSYRPWASVLAGIAAEDDGLRIVAGDLDPRLAALPPARRRDVVATDVASALRAAAPAVVVLEDLHWADQPSLDLFDDLLHALRGTDLLLIATSREPVSTTATLPVLEVAPLVDDAVAVLVTELLGGLPPMCWSPTSHGAVGATRSTSPSSPSRYATVAWSSSSKAACSSPATPGSRQPSTSYPTRSRA